MVLVASTHPTHARLLKYFIRVSRITVSVLKPGWEPFGATTLAPVDAPANSHSY